MKEQATFKGFYRFQGYDKDTGELVIDTKWLKNVLTNINRQYRQAMLDGTFISQGFDARDLEIKYFALGDGATPATPNDTQLVNERVRRPVTRISTSGSDTSSITVFQPDQANFRIREVGIFAGPAADETANSGILLSRIVVDFTKNSNIVLNINRIDRTVI